MIFVNILLRYRVVNDSLFFIVASGEEKGIIEPGAVRTVNVSPNMTAIIKNQHLFTRVLFTTNSLCTRLHYSLTNIQIPSNRKNTLKNTSLFTIPLTLTGNDFSENMLRKLIEFNDNGLYLCYCMYRLTERYIVSLRLAFGCFSEMFFTSPGTKNAYQFATLEEHIVRFLRNLKILLYKFFHHHVEDKGQIFDSTSPNTCYLSFCFSP